jgi:hypothetical protein
LGKKRRAQRKDDFGFGDATKLLVGTVAFGTTALVGVNLINQFGDL